MEFAMDKPISMRFESKLSAPPGRVWEWITSLEGISTEMWPFFRMTFPKGVRSLNDVEIKHGIRMFRSYVFLFGILPIDYSDMTLMELDTGKGFVEQSPMGSMSLWRHERRLTECRSDPPAVILVDILTFCPRIAKRFFGWFIRHVFIHRHKVLKANLCGV
jgi:hypothetical protein